MYLASFLLQKSSQNLCKPVKTGLADVMPLQSHPLFYSRVVVHFSPDKHIL